MILSRRSARLNMNRPLSSQFFETPWRQDAARPQRSKTMIYDDRARNDPKSSVNEDLNGSRERSWAPWSFSRVKYEGPPKTARYSSLFILPSVFSLACRPPLHTCRHTSSIGYRFARGRLKYRWISTTLFTRCSVSIAPLSAVPDLRVDPDESN